MKFGIRKSECGKEKHGAESIGHGVKADIGLTNDEGRRGNLLISDLGF